MIGLYISAFFGGAVFVNAIPHFVQGVSGHTFTSPFAKPPGKGESSAAVNVQWGAFNFLLAYVLLGGMVPVNLHDGVQRMIAAAGGLLMAFILASNFSRTRGGRG